MPVCVLCDNETFEAVDGLYYCTTCGTQSQDIRDEVAAEDALHLGRKLSKKGGKRGRQKIPREKGKPWVIYEAYQFIIKAQVEALISLGVNSSLKDVVGQLWFRYLQKKGVAFTGASEGSMRIQVQNIKGAVQKNGGDDLQDEIKLCSELDEEEFYEEDNPLRYAHGDETEHEIEKDKDDEMNYTQKNLIDDSSSSDDDDDDDDVLGSVILTMENTNNACKTPANKLYMFHTLSFCYLGLLWMKEPVFLSDLLRWVKEGNLPYYQISTILPKHMKFTGYDASMFSSHNLPKYKAVFKGTSQLVRFLCLPRLDNLDILVYTSRFILDLQLPAVLHGVVNSLTKILKPAKTHKSKNLYYLVPPDIEAMAYIMVSLGICYDLSDQTNGENVENKDVETQSDKADFLSDINDWLQCRRKCQSKKLSRGVPWTNEELKHVRDPTKYTGFSAEEIYGSWARPDPVLHEQRYQPFGPFAKSWHKESRAKLSMLFKSLIPEEELGNLAQVKEKPASFPATCRHLAEEERGEAHGGDNGRCYANLGQHCFSLNTEDKGIKTNCLYYIYPKNELESFESSDHPYICLLKILADRISVGVNSLHHRVNTLERLLFKTKWSKRHREFLPT